ncbi:vegetative cell wall protein gp1-like [Iris pallida]|uniref:Vegetative cell wall protein gp1-like n=1 Tax=Iris pallida TaxID=29817 RepID=A0AAX6H084_IRIPA|nr:vegetative cell wall protein gp1-like [Iris pallida]KAJ6834001.1 vegetative cell wall protein gp1-like [Iris pallida]
MGRLSTGHLYQHTSMVSVDHQPLHLHRLFWRSTGEAALVSCRPESQPPSEQYHHTPP